MVKPETELKLDADLCLLKYLCGLLDMDTGTDFDFDAVNADFWPELTRIASEQLVLTVMAGAFDLAGLPSNSSGADEAMAFFRQIESTNRQRNEWLLQQLDAASLALSKAGIPAIAVKGGAFLLEERTNAAAWRFFGDLDLMVSEDRLFQAVAVLKTLGYVESDLVYHPKFHRHYPFLSHPSGQTGIDLHTRAAGLDQSVLLDPDRFFSNGVTISTGGAEIMIPGSTDRLAHLIVNAQILDYRYQRRLFRLRDVLDFARLIIRPETDMDEIRDRFEAYGKMKPLLAYLALMGDVLGSHYQPPEDASGEVKWVRAVRKVMQNPARAKIYLVHHWFQMLAVQLGDSNQRRHLFQRLADPDQRAEFIARRLSYWRIFQR